MYLHIDMMTTKCEVIMKDDLIKSIIKKLEYFKYGKGAIEVYRDCIEHMALNLAISTDTELDNSLRERYEEIFKNYSNEDKQKAKEICVDITYLLAEFENNYCDYLGELYMRVISEYGKPRLNQYFTPYHVSHLMAEMTLDMGNNNSKKPITINEPCCGSGGMCVACLDVLNNKNINYLTDALIIANDIDETCVYMTYLQLSFCGAAAIIEQKDTLTQKKFKELKTLGYYLQKEYYITHQNNTTME